MISGRLWLFELSIIGLMRRARCGWDEVNKWQTNTIDGGLCSSVIPGRCRQSGPDVLWVTPGGSGDFAGHARVALCTPHGTQLGSPSTKLTFDLLTPPPIHVREECLLHFSFPVASVFTYSFTCLQMPPCSCLRGIFTYQGRFCSLNMNHGWI